MNASSIHPKRMYTSDVEDVVIKEKHVAKLDASLVTQRGEVLPLVLFVDLNELTGLAYIPERLAARGLEKPKRLACPGRHVASRGNANASLACA